MSCSIGKSNPRRGLDKCSRRHVHLCLYADYHILGRKRATLFVKVDVKSAMRVSSLRESLAKHVLEAKREHNILKTQAGNRLFRAKNNVFLMDDIPAIFLTLEEA